jgi:hypothetical protein
MAPSSPPLLAAIALALSAVNLACAALTRGGRDASWVGRGGAAPDIGGTLRAIAAAVREGRDPAAAGRWWRRDGVTPPPRSYNTTSRIVRGMINVHLVPHSHDDVGWLKTVDQYAEGSHNGIQHTNVNLEIDTVLTSLLENADRKFIFVEQAFFSRWVEQQTDATIALMRSVVESGQLEMVNGAWAMHDEAAPSYVDMIDQTSLGHRVIKDLFDVVPKTTWQIDPFGHSTTQSSLLSSMLAGYNAVFFGRIDYQDRLVRELSQSLEGIWRASSSLGASAQTFFGAMDGYGPPLGDLCWDEVACGDNEPIQDDERLEEFNVPLFTYSASLAAIAMSLLYRPDSDGTVHLLWPMGVGRSRLLSLQMYTALAQPPHSPGSFLPARRSRTSSTPMHAAISRTWTS